LILPFRTSRGPAISARPTRAEMWELLAQTLTAMETAIGAQVHNGRLQPGTAAGAGTRDHLHLHVVPRWLGRRQLHAVLADVRVMPQHLSETACCSGAACRTSAPSRGRTTSIAP